MTVTANTPGSDAVEKREDLITLTIDGVEVSVPKGTLVIRAAEQVGVQIPRFCDHPLLDPVGACRQCLVEVPDAGNGRAIPKPQASCTLQAAEGMVVRTQATSAVADKAQQGIMEFLLINHPLDCPMCDKGGECPLQNQAMSNGRGESRYVEQKRTYPKPINISAQVLLDRERCILCARCTRFSEQIAGDPFIEMVERGALQQVGIYEQEPFESYFSGNTIQICPVGALTSASYRFRSRPFDLVSVPTICEHCASGCELRTDFRRGKVMRRLAGNDPEVNEEWNCDKGRFGFTYTRQPDRLTHPLVRDEALSDGASGAGGKLRPASWPEAFAVAARGLQAAGRVGVLTGGRLSTEDAYAYAKFARVALGTNDIDFRSRRHSAEEAEFLAARVAGTSPGTPTAVTYRDLERAGKVLLVGFEPEDESPIVFLRLRKAARKHGTSVYSVAPYTTRGLHKMHGTLVRTAPGEEPAVLEDLARDSAPALGSALGASDVILVGERMAAVPGALSRVAALADASGARLAWVPRRAGDRGAVEAGCLPNLLPGGRPVVDAAARVDVGTVWGATVPPEPGRDASAMVAAAAAGELKGLVIGGVGLADLPDATLAAEAVHQAEFVVSLELRAGAVTELADVVFPVAPVTDKAGSFVDWEGRVRPFEAVFRETRALPDLRVLSGIAEEMDVDLGFRTVDQVRAEMNELEPWDGERVRLSEHAPEAPVRETTGVGTPSVEVVLATWKQLVDEGRMLDGEEFLRATGRRPVALVSAATLARIGVLEGERVTMSGPHGSTDLPVAVADLPDGVVWAPASAPGAHLSRDLGVGSGSLVRLAGHAKEPRPEPAGSEGGLA